jgi:hypothetical protein
MEKAKKVKAKVVDDRHENSRHAGNQGKHTIKDRLYSILLKFKLGIALLLDACDLILANIPLLNTLWDFVTFSVLIVILRNKWLAFAAFAELPLVGLPFFGQIDALIPMATILTLADSAESRFRFVRIN